MKRIILAIAVLVLIPVMSFAELAVGGAAMIKSPVFLGSSSVNEDLDINQFCFGGDIRIKQDWLQVEALVLGAASDVCGVDIYSDIGVALDVSPVRFSMGVGPNLNWNFGVTPLFQSGMNAKIGADIMLDTISVGVTYIMSMKYNEHVEIYNKSGLFGLQVLFWL